MSVKGAPPLTSDQGTPTPGGRKAASLTETRWEEHAFALRPRLIAMARRVVRDQAEAEDVVDETISRLAEAHERGRPPDHTSAWLFRTATHLSIDRARRWLRQQRFLERGPALRSVPGPEEAAERHELREAVWRSLLSLPRRQREVMVLHQLEGLPYGSVAEILDLEETTARAHAYAARHELRRKLSEWRNDRG